MKAKPVNFLKENIEEYLHDLIIQKILFSERTLKKTLIIQEKK